MICAKRILNRRVAAAIAYREQVSPSIANWNAFHRSDRKGKHAPMLSDNRIVNNESN
jgi:hypothetical protein